MDAASVVSLLCQVAFSCLSRLLPQARLNRAISSCTQIRYNTCRYECNSMLQWYNELREIVCRCKNCITSFNHLPAFFFWIGTRVQQFDHLIWPHNECIFTENACRHQPFWSWWSSGHDCATIKIQTELQQCAHSCFWHLALNRTWCMDHSITVPILEGSASANVWSCQAISPWKLHRLSWLYRMTLWWSWMDGLQVPHTCLCTSRTLGLPWNCGTRYCNPLRFHLADVLVEDLILMCLQCS